MVITFPENLDVYFSALMFVLGAYFIALYIGLIVWTFRDIRSRSRDVLAQIMATLMVAVFTLPGLLIYMLLRPHVTLSEQYERSLTEEAILHDLNEERVCSSCQHQVEADFVVCPYCHTQLKLRCTGCGRLLSPEWTVCPYCGLIHEQPQETSAPSEAAKQERPDESLRDSKDVTSLADMAAGALQSDDRNREAADDIDQTPLTQN